MSRVYPLPPDTAEGRPAELVDLMVEQFPLAGFARPDGASYTEFAAAVRAFLFGGVTQIDDRLLTEPEPGQCRRCRARHGDDSGKVTLIEVDAGIARYECRCAWWRFSSPIADPDGGVL